jgi:class 3 adenylate cyclase/tetratricopeptide (TPR) repeat protein
VIMGNKSFQIGVTSLMEAHPDVTVQSVAVLMTDVMGTNRYFQAHGSKAGTEMLEGQHEIISSAVAAHDGLMVDTVGDSAMACFADPNEAIRAAIRVQHMISARNEWTGNAHKIFVRIGVNYGSSVAGEDDPYAHIINVASIFADLSDGNQILVSQEVYKLAANQQHIHFELVNPWQKRQIPKDLTIYKVIWDRSAEFLAPTRPYLLLWPLWQLCDSNFSETWTETLEEKSKAWRQQCEVKEVLPDKSVILVFKDAESWLAAPILVLEALREKMKRMNDLFVPVHAILDVDPYHQREESLRNIVPLRMDVFSPGQTYISERAYKFMSKRKGLEIDPSALVRDGDQIFYGLSQADGSNAPKAQEFLFRKPLVRGSHSPCFYCGGRQHKPADCLSKRLNEQPYALNALGHLSVDAINDLFYRYLIVETSDTDDKLRDQGPPDESVRLAMMGFYELKRVFQLRFFRGIWSATTDEWEKVKKTNSPGEGGLTWLALDSLRVSDLDRAESILLDVMGRLPGDYRVYITAGFLSVEKDDALQARSFFEEALVHAKTPPQRILALLLMARLHIIAAEYDRAYEQLHQILTLDRDCPEAVYQDAVLKLREGRTDSAVRQLLGLVERKRDYYVQLLIDPDLASASDVINPELLNLSRNARKEASTFVAEAKREFTRARHILNTAEISDLESKWSEIEILSKTDSYFNHLDIIGHSASVISASRNILGRRTREMSEVFRQLNRRLETMTSFVRSYPYPKLIHAFKSELEVQRNRIRDTEEACSAISPETLLLCNRLYEQLSAEWDQMDRQLKGLKLLPLILQYSTGFSRISGTLLAIVWFIGLFVVPFLKPLLDEYQSLSDMWYHRNGFLFFGSMFSVGIPLLVTLARKLKDT